MVILKLVRFPRTRPTHEAMAKEVGKEYVMLGGDIQDALYTMLGPGWQNKPKVTTVVKVTKKEWSIKVKIDRRTRGGKRFWWASAGTGIYGPKHRPYIIRPRRAKALRFQVPYKPKTLPATAFTQRARSLETGGGTKTVLTKRVVATGIRPRKFHIRLAAMYNNRRWTGGFYRRSENAARRGMRRGKIQHVKVS